MSNGVRNTNMTLMQAQSYRDALSSASQQAGQQMQNLDIGSIVSTLMQLFMRMLSGISG